MYCDKGNPPEYVRQPGWVTARGWHPKQVTRSICGLGKGAGMVKICLSKKPKWAVGEVGLDYHLSTQFEIAAQKDFLAEIVRGLHGIAGVPLILHLREANEHKRELAVVEV